MANKPENLLNRRFGQLKVIAFHSFIKPNGILWRCLCSCGKETLVPRGRLVTGMTKSCGHLQKEIAAKMKFVHGMAYTRFYRIWQGIVGRTENERNKGYKEYGGRGIKNEWKNFIDFKKDMLEAYEKHVKEYGEKNTSIDRIDNNGNYSKKNCRWATWKEQSANQRECTRLFRNNTSGFHNVGRLPKGRWRARPYFNGKPVSLGCFSTPEEANVAIQNFMKKIKDDKAQEIKRKKLDPMSEAFMDFCEKDMGVHFVDVIGVNVSGTQAKKRKKSTICISCGNSFPRKTDRTVSHCPTCRGKKKFNLKGKLK